MHSALGAAALMMSAIFSTTAFAAIKTKVIEYKQGDTVLEGYLAYDDALPGRRPGVLVVHDWMGVGPSTKGRVEQLAGLGYAAFAADIYGKGVRPGNPKDAGATAGIYKKDRALMRARAQAGLDTLSKQDQVDSNQLAVMGYCFGGTTALELGRSGADVKGIVSFHGGLETPRVEDAKNIKGKVLVLHGADDPSVPPQQVQAFEDEMRKAKVDWQLVAYGNAVHAFTEPKAGNDNSKGAAYNAAADRRSWNAMRDFFAEVFGAKQASR